MDRRLSALGAHLCAPTAAPAAAPTTEGKIPTVHW
jgi:hypothetical protein